MTSTYSDTDVTAQNDLQKASYISKLLSVVVCASIEQEAGIERDTNRSDVA